jgi:hypothetical protein
MIKFLPQKQSDTETNAEGRNKGELLTLFHVGEVQTLNIVQRRDCAVSTGRMSWREGKRAVDAFTIDLPMPMSCLIGTERQTAEHPLLPTAREPCQILGNYTAVKWKIFRHRITKLWDTR